MNILTDLKISSYLKFNNIVTEDYLRNNKEARKANVICAVHSGVFHADDVVSAVLVVALREALLARTEPVLIVRTRDQKVLASADVCVDVGEGQYDHHGAATDSCGECYPGIRHCGCTLVAKACGLDAYPRIWRELCAIAATDNGQLRPAELQKCSFDFIHDFVPAWDSEESMDEAFLKASAAARDTLRRLIQLTESDLRAAEILRKAASSGEEVVQLPSGGMPWQEYLATSEAKFVIFPSADGKSYMLQAVPPNPGSFDKKLPFPPAWAGKRGKDLEAASGVPGAVFCHAGGFIGGWQTSEQCLAAANKILHM